MALKPTSLFCSSGEKIEVVQKEVADMLKGRILVGHALRNDLKVLPSGVGCTTRGLHCWNSGPGNGTSSRVLPTCWEEC